MTPVDLVALSMWPLAAAGIWLGYKSLPPHAKDIRRVLLRALSALALFAAIGAFIAVAIFFPHHSATAVAMTYSIAAGIGVLLLYGVWRNRFTRLRAIAFAALGFTSLGWGLYNLAGDFLLRRVQIEGYVSDKRIVIREPCTRACIPDYTMGVGTKRYQTTKQVFDAVAAGQRVRAEIGRISERVLAVQPLPF